MPFRDPDEDSLVVRDALGGRPIRGAAEGVQLPASGRIHVTPIDHPHTPCSVCPAIAAVWVEWRGPSGTFTTSPEGASATDRGEAIAALSEGGVAAPFCFRHGQAKCAELRRRPILALAPLTLPAPDSPFSTPSMPADRHPAFVYLARLARGSHRTMKEALDTIAQIVAGPDANAANLPWQGLRYSHTAVIRAALVERYAPATANKMLSALRGVLREAWRLGILDTESYHRAVGIDDVKGQRIPVGLALSRAQITSLFAACAADPSSVGRRDAALLALLLGTGVRRAEAVALMLADYDPQDGQITIRRGKGGKDRRNWIGEEGRRAIAEWLVVRGTKAGPILCPFTCDSGSSVAVTAAGAARPRPGRAMSTEAVYVRLRVLADRAGIPRFAPHDTRRTYITRAIEEGEDLVTVQRLAGHARIETTARYDRRGDVALREAALRRFIPFQAAAAPPSIATPPPTEAAAPLAAPAPSSPDLEEVEPSWVALPPPTSSVIEDTTRSAPSKEPEKSPPPPAARPSGDPPRRKKAPRIAAGASSRAKTARRTREAKTKRPGESRRKPGKAQRLRGGKSRIALRSTPSARKNARSASRRK